MSEIDPATPIQPAIHPSEAGVLEGPNQFQTESDQLAEGRAALDKIEASAPELLEGRVPQELEERVFAAGFTEYAVGFNQSDGVVDIDEATELLEEDGGIRLQMYNLDQRFLLHDKEDPTFMYPLGYYGPRVGRFVYVIPTREVPGETPHSTAARASEAFTDNVPGDLFIELPDGETSVNAKYCAGFIDDEQNFHQNPEFMKDRLEPGELGGVALAGEVSLDAAVDTEASRLADRIAEVHGFLEESGLDIDTQTSKFEESVRQRVNQMWKVALAEGRHQLKEGEITEIRRMNQLVKEQREFVKAYHQAGEVEAAKTSAEVAIQNAQAQADRLFELSKQRQLSEPEKYAYRKAKQFLAKKADLSPAQ